MNRTRQQLVCLAETVTRPGSFLLAFVVATIIVGVSLWLPNWRLVLATIGSSTLDIGEQLRILTSLFGSLETNFTTLTRGYLFLIASLAGLQCALTVRYIRAITKQKRSLGTPLLGILVGIAGIGCASCGSILLTSVFGLGVTTALLGALPYRGYELGILRITVLLVTLWYTTRRMTAPEICKR